MADDLRTVVTAEDHNGGIRAVVSRERPTPPEADVTCPFYGLMGHRSGLLLGFPGGGGNACALAFAHTPCRLRIEGRRPDWDGCEVRNPTGRGEALRALAGFRVSPPSGGDVPMEEWFARTMGREWPAGG